MDGGDRGLQRVRTDPSRRERARHQCGAFADLIAIPQPAILVGEQHDFAGRRRARRAPGFVEQHEREQADRLGLGQQIDQQSSEPNRLARQVHPRHRLSRRRRIALVEHEIDHAQHAVEPLGQLRRLRDLIRNAGVADFCLRPHDALRERGRGAQERLRDLFGGEPADLAQRERDLRVRRERRVAAREDQTQPVVFDRFVARRRFVGDRLDLVDPVLERVEARAPADAVDRLETPGGYEPGARVRGHAFARPLLERRPERLVKRFLGDVEIAEQPDERREHASRLGTVDGVERAVDAVQGLVAHDRSRVPGIGRRSLACINRVRYTASATIACALAGRRHGRSPDTSGQSLT